ncbi:MAG: hypothetical protein M3511_13495 [Deinococcota bacterium]|nr:hypothetical protein [Deinococcota bacterium]
MIRTQSTPLPEANILIEETTREATVARLQEHLPLDVKGYKPERGYVGGHHIPHAAVTGRSVEASCQELDVAVSSNTVREQLNAHLPGDHRLRGGAGARVRGGGVR